MFFGLTIEKLVLIGVIAALIIGPERLPKYAEALARFTRRVRDYAQGARERVRDEMGSDFDDVDWRKLDPRQYDPRRIIREALLEEAPVKPSHPMAAAVTAAAADGAVAATDTGTNVESGGTAVAGPTVSAVTGPLGAGDMPPFDSEAT